MMRVSMTLEEIEKTFNEGLIAMELPIRLKEIKSIEVTSGLLHGPAEERLTIRGTTTKEGYRDDDFGDSITLFVTGREKKVSYRDSDIDTNYLYDVFSQEVSKSVSY